MSQTSDRIPCPHCQANNFPSSATCWQCGQPLHQQQDQPPAQPPPQPGPSQPVPPQPPGGYQPTSRISAATIRRHRPDLRDLGVHLRGGGAVVLSVRLQRGGDHHGGSRSEQGQSAGRMGDWRGCSIVGHRRGCRCDSRSFELVAVLQEPGERSKLAVGGRRSER